MTTAVVARQTLDWQGRRLLDGAGATPAAFVREAIQRALWNPALRLWCRPLIADGLPLKRPAVYVANHASHADTALVRAAMGTGRRRLAVAAADDYFFATARRGAAFTLAVGAFPFPRSGDIGLRRAAALLSSEWSVLLYPQGTRDSGSEFRPGALRLAHAGWPIVPVGIAGTDVVLPKGARRPWRAATAVSFGAPLRRDQLDGDGGFDIFVEAITTAAARARHLTEQ